jgi:ADP-sugar diphosphatase
MNHLEKGVEVSKIEILGVEMFGENVGFINMRAITQKEGFKLPSYLFLRGHAVAILMLVNKKILLVEQYRVAVQQTMLEAPAGMIDESGDFIGVAAKEIEEETSIKINKE